MTSFSPLKQWNYTIYFALTIIIVPIYLIILICLLRLRLTNLSFRTTFYTVLFQHSIADILSVVLYTFMKLFSLLFPLELYNFNYIPLAPIIYYTVVWGITIRSHGISILTVHRYLTIVKPFHPFTHRIQQAKLWEIVLFYWFPPILFCLIFFSDGRVKFESPENLQTLGETPEITDKVTKTCIVVVLTSSLICIVCYVLISKFIRESSNVMSNSMKRELRLALQVFILLTAQLVLFLYMTFINVFANQGNPEIVGKIKRFTPIANGLPSFFSPITILLFNKELSKRVRKMMKGEKTDNLSDASAVVSIGITVFPTANKNKKMSDSSELIPLTWPLLVYYGMSFVSLPLYFIVFSCLLRLRCFSKSYNTTFYSILLQHCIADLLAMLLFFATSPARNIPFIRQFFFNYQQYYIAAGSYNSIYYFLYVRCSGIVFLSLQRYLVITSPSTWLTDKVQNASKLQIVIVYWTVPTLISIVVLKDNNFYFDSYEEMSIIAPPEVIQRNTLMALIVVSITCVICSLSYGALFFFVRKHTLGLSKSLRRELHLAFQVFVLLLAFFAILVYYAFQNYFSQTHNTGPIFYMRAIYPIANGLLSYINPFCILFLNKDLAFQVARSITCHKYKVSEVQISTIVSNSNKNGNSSNRNGKQKRPEEAHQIMF